MYLYNSFTRQVLPILQRGPESQVVALAVLVGEAHDLRAPSSGLTPGLPQAVWLQETRSREVTWGTPHPLPHSHRQLEQLEVKRSGLTKELVEVREALSCATLQRDMLQAEKAEVAEALAKVGPFAAQPQTHPCPRPQAFSLLPQTDPYFRLTSDPGHRRTPSFWTRANF